MKKQIIFLSIVTSLLFGCQESKEDLQGDIAKLNGKKTSISSEVQSLEASKDNIQAQILELQSKLKELKIYDSGKIPQYILKIHLSQSHLSLSISQHMKDAANAVDFELPVAKEFYDSVKEGDKIVDNFRAGSFMLYGSIGSWDMKITKKEIR